jgi:hypothetical protein
VVAGKRRFGNIRRRASGRFQVRYAGPDGTVHSAPRTFATEEEAEDWLIVTEADIIRGDWWDPEAGRVPFGPYAARWIEERQLATRTREKYERLLRVHLGPTFKTTDLVDITPGLVRSWRGGLLAKGTGGPTVAGAYRLMRAVLNTAVDDELLRKNPCRIKGADQDNAPERPTVTIAEVYAIADAIQPWWRALVLMAAFSSLRWGELIWTVGWSRSRRSWPRSGGGSRPACRSRRPAFGSLRSLWRSCPTWPGIWASGRRPVPTVGCSSDPGERPRRAATSIGTGRRR